MKTYGNIGGDSGVSAYDYGEDWIHVQFSDGSVYEYTHASAGEGNVEEMKRLADGGKGLNAFVNAKVKKLYSKKIR